MSAARNALPPGHPPVSPGRWRVAGWAACAVVALAAHGTVAAAVLSRGEPPIAGESPAPMPVEIATIAFEDPEAVNSADAAEAKGESEQPEITETPVNEPLPEAVADKTTTVDAPPEPEAKLTEAPPPEPEKVNEPEPPKPEEQKAETQPEPPVVDAAAKESPAAEVAATALAAPPQAEPVPVAPAPPVRKVRPKEKVRAVTGAQKAARTQVAKASTASQAATGEAENAARTASAAVSRDFGARVRAAIERRKRFPPGVDTTGVAAVRFTMAADGSVVSVALAQSAGNAELDAAALGAVRTARLPPIPAEMEKSRLTITVPIRFRR